MENGWKDSICKAAQKHGADPERAWVWDLFSSLFLDTEQTKEEVKDIARNLAETRFTIPELVHIYDKEVNPVCVWNMFMWEWAGFDPDWLIPRCMKEQSVHPYSASTKRHHEPPFNLSFAYWDACELIEEIKKLRQARGSLS